MWRSPTGCKLDATAAPHGVENASSGSGRDPARAVHGGPALGLGCGTEFGSIKISGFFFAEGKGKTISEREGKIPPVFLGREGGGNSDKKETAAPAESAFVVYRDGAESAASGGGGGGLFPPWWLPKISGRRTWLARRGAWRLFELAVESENTAVPGLPVPGGPAAAV